MRLSVGKLVLLLFQVARFIQGALSGCEDQALGMENGDIPDNALTGFPPSLNGNKAKNCRVNKPPVFCPSSPPAGSYIQIDLGTLHDVCAVGTQGFDGGQNDFMKTYQVDWSSDGAKWFEYKENGVTKIFDGNVNHKDVKKNTISAGLKTRYIRIRPLTWYVYPCFRVELYGRQYSFPQGGNTLFVPLGENHALSGHVIKSTVATYAIACLWECMLPPQCKSFNYNHVTRSCEMNSATKEESPGEFVKRDGFTYYAAKSVEMISF